ncbi:MAG: RagB/SusD family nutrient uptake outer membrane protein, partial [Chitinophagaceae bacterium]
INHIKKIFRYKITSLLIFGLLLSVSACKKFVQVGPPVTSLNQDNIYENDKTAIASLTGIYIQLSNNNNLDLSIYPGLSSDELTLYSGVTSNQELIDFYKNSLKASTSYGSNYWGKLYNVIFNINAAIEGLSSSSKLTPEIKQKLLGEAYFLRGYVYFYLTNLFGDVPLALTTEYTTNSNLVKSPKDLVFGQILSDLNQAKGLLSPSYLDASLIKVSTERVRPVQSAASAMLARTFLYKGDYINAEKEASLVLANTSSYDTVSLNNVFIKNSKETIWSIQPVINVGNTADARLFIIPGTGPSTTYWASLSSNMLSAFETGDKRLVNWVSSVTVSGKTYFFPYKYKVVSTVPVTTSSEYLVVLRLGEQYLIRAEARAQLGNLAGALNDLNLIRKRARLSASTATTKTDILTAIIRERQVELFAEGAHRWLDLKRTNTIDNVMSTVTSQKGGVWNSSWALYPIGQEILDRSPSLSQNPGY